MSWIPPQKTYQVINHTQNQVVASQVCVANNPWTRFWGLMGKVSLPSGHGLWISSCNQIHSCFMRFAFDAVFLDKEGVVRYWIEGMKPWKLSRLVWGGHAVLELPQGTLQAHPVALGDQLVLEG